jgi:hypothetical protein
MYALFQLACLFIIVVGIRVYWDRIKNWPPVQWLGKIIGIAQLIPIIILMAIIVVPIVCLVWLITWPYTALARWIFSTRMERRGRAVHWHECAKRIGEGKGTLLIQHRKETVLHNTDRWWWTDENVYETCPYALGDWQMMSCLAEFKPALDWCSGRYMATNGSAILILHHKRLRKDLTQKRTSLFRDGVRWLDIARPGAIKDEKYLVSRWSEEEE